MRRRSPAHSTTFRVPNARQTRIRLVARDLAPRCADRRAPLRALLRTRRLQTHVTRKYTSADIRIVDVLRRQLRRARPGCQEQVPPEHIASRRGRRDFLEDVMQIEISSRHKRRRQDHGDKSEEAAHGTRVVALHERGACCPGFDARNPIGARAARIARDTRGPGVRARRVRTPPIRQRMLRRVKSDAARRYKIRSCIGQDRGMW